MVFCWVVCYNWLRGSEHPLYTIVDTSFKSLVFNVMLQDGKEALTKFTMVRGLRTNYDIWNEDGEWALTNQWRSRFVAIKF